uniref:Fam-c protein n=1 Tax=Strongyloides venezuelensis TaxID=75913 RepID=A0A0K0FGY3_STRVS
MKLAINNFRIFVLLLFISIYCNIDNVTSYSLRDEGNSDDNKIDITLKKATTTSLYSNLDTNRIEDSDHRKSEKDIQEIKEKWDRKMQKECEKIIDKEHGYYYDLINATIHSQHYEPDGSIGTIFEFFIKRQSDEHIQQLCAQSWLNGQNNSLSCDIEECFWESAEYESSENNF